MTATRRDGQRRTLGAAVGRTPADWALSEDQQIRPTRRRWARSGSSRAQRVLDIGCGVGAFLRLVADRGARAVRPGRLRGPDRARSQRLPDADLRVGDMEALPYDDDTFDLVTGFTRSSSPTTSSRRSARPAGREAGRSGRHPGVGRRTSATIPRGDEGDREAVLPAAPARRSTRARLLPARRARGPRDSQRASRPKPASMPSWAYTYPDDETLGRALVAPAGIAVLVGPEREDAIKAAIVAGPCRYRTPDGSYRLDNEYHYLIARAMRLDFAVIREAGPGWHDGGISSSRT